MEEKLARIEEMEKMMQDRERAMREATLEAEERAALMEIRLREFEEKTRANAEAAEKQQEAMLQNVQNAVNAAASAINMDPDLVNVAMGSPPGTDRLSARNTGRMGRTPRRYIMYPHLVPLNYSFQLLQHLPTYAEQTSTSLPSHTP